MFSQPYEAQGKSEVNEEEMMRDLRFSLLPARRVSAEIPRRAGRKEEGEAGRVRRVEITALPLYST